MTETWQTCLFDMLCNFFNGSAIKYGCRKLQSQFFSGPSQHSFIDLSKIHTGRNAQRVQYDIHWCAIFEEGHVLRTDYLGNYPFVTMPASHLVSNLQLT